MLKHKLIQDVAIPKICMKFNQNQSINESSGLLNIFLGITTLILTLALESRNLNLIKIFSYIVNICVKLQQNWSINEGVRAITMFFFLKIVTVTLMLALEHSNSNLSKILSYKHLCDIKSKSVH